MSKADWIQLRLKRIITAYQIFGLLNYRKVANKFVFSPTLFCWSLFVNISFGMCFLRVTQSHILYRFGRTEVNIGKFIVNIFLLISCLFFPFGITCAYIFMRKLAKIFNWLSVCTQRFSRMKFYDSKVDYLFIFYNLAFSLVVSAGLYKGIARHIYYDRNLASFFIYSTFSYSLYSKTYLYYWLYRHVFWTLTNMLHEINANITKQSLMLSQLAEPKRLDWITDRLIGSLDRKFKKISKVHKMAVETFAIFMLSSLLLTVLMSMVLTYYTIHSNFYKVILFLPSYMVALSTSTIVCVTSQQYTNEIAKSGRKITDWGMSKSHISQLKLMFLCKRLEDMKEIKPYEIFSIGNKTLVSMLEVICVYTIILLQVGENSL